MQKIVSAVGDVPGSDVVFREIEGGVRNDGVQVDQDAAGDGCRQKHGQHFYRHFRSLLKGFEEITRDGQKSDYPF